jgi:hypothetical protein
MTEQDERLAAPEEGELHDGGAGPADAPGQADDPETEIGGEG